MKKVFIGLLLAVGVWSVMASVHAAPAPATAQRRGAPVTAAAPASAGVAGRGVSAPAGNATSAAPSAAGVRAATSVAARTTAARSGVTPVAAAGPKSAGVAARAATTQAVMQSGTKIAAAGTNTVVSEACRTKYEGCMDSFCMLDNDNGGRCLCSNRKADLDKVAADISKMNTASFNMADRGVERINMGSSADNVMGNVNAIVDQETQKAMGDSSTTPSNAPPTNDPLAAWNTISFDDDGETYTDPLAGKTGDTLHAAVRDICLGQMPECATEKQMLVMLYSQHIQSDCVTFENGLKVLQQDAQTKLQTAQRNLRAAAVDQYNKSNEYDEGQCAAAFKKCMQTTAGCGDDFVNCASVSAIDATNFTTGAQKQYSSKFVSSNPKCIDTSAQNRSSSKLASNSTKCDIIGPTGSAITVSMSTMDAVLAKRPMCDNVTQSCQAVVQADKDRVWNIFLADIGPTLKSAELIAESNLRQNCIGNISDCFQKACRDTMDPNNPEGSFDMCLSQPGSMLNVCKVQLNACGVDTTSQTAAAKSDIWYYITARLAAMRVDACTTQIKSCLQSEDRCGDNYGQCTGLNIDTVIEFCPIELLTACNKDDIEDRIYGILLGISNEAQTKCQALVDAKMTEICGDTSDCPKMADNTSFGTEGLSAIDDTDGGIKIVGLVDFNNLMADQTQKVNNISITRRSFLQTYTPSGKGNQFLTQSQQTASSVGRIADSFIARLSGDEQIKACIEGRDVAKTLGTRAAASLTKARVDTTKAAQFPNLLDDAITTINESALRIGRQNYETKFNKLVKDATQRLQDNEATRGAAGLCYDPAIFGPIK